jgi:hypothetical protein
VRLRYLRFLDGEVICRRGFEIALPVEPSERERIAALIDQLEKEMWSKVAEMNKAAWQKGVDHQLEAARKALSEGRIDRAFVALQWLKVLRDHSP